MDRLVLGECIVSLIASLSTFFNTHEYIKHNLVEQRQVTKMKSYYVVREKPHKNFITYVVYQRQYRPEIWRELKKKRYHEYYVGSYRDYALDQLPDDGIKAAVFNYIERHKGKT